MKIFSTMKIGNRLGFGFAVVLAFSILIAGIGVWQLHAVAEASRDMMQEPLTKERYISDWNRNINVAVIRTTAVAKSSDPSLVPFFQKNAVEVTQSSSELLKKIEPLVSSKEEKELFAKIAVVRKAYMVSRDQVTKLKAEGQADAANSVLEKSYIPDADNYMKLVAEFLGMQRNTLDAKASEISKIENTSRNYLVALAALALTFGVVCAWLLTTGITGPLKSAVAVARRVADGDLSGEIEVHTKDEIGQLLHALKDMNDSLIRIVSDVRAGTDTIATASSQIAAGNMDLSSRTEQQASSLEETAASMEELTTTVKQNADNARQANGLAAAASAVAVKGGAVVSQVVGTMASINDSSKKIVDIISVIDGIAFQTNILALNAAVEAARAGEQGRGFAVVATEVRNLAQRSAAAAKEIKALIGDSVDKVATGSKLVGEAGSTMDEVVASVRRVTDIMGEISAASVEQSAGIAQVNQAIAQMDEVTQQNAALVEQAAAAAEGLQAQAGNLAQVVDVFRIDGMHISALATPAIAAVPPSGIAAPVRKTAKAAPARIAPAASMSSRSTAKASAAGGDEWEEF